MNRGDVYWVHFEPAVGGEIRKTRPAVILSNDSSNRFLNRVQVVPVTSNVSKVFPSEALITVAGGPRKAMADRLTTVSKKRLGAKLGRIGPEDLLAVERAILVQLGFDRP